MAYEALRNESLHWEGQIQHLNDLIHDGRVTIWDLQQEVIDLYQEVTKWKEDY